MCRPTVSWPRVTVMAASNFSAVCTNLAEARACRPFFVDDFNLAHDGSDHPLTRVGSFTVEDPAGNRAVLAASFLGGRDRILQRANLADFRELDQHR